MKLPLKAMLILGFAISSPVANAAKLIVIDARAAGIKAGQRLDSAKPITLKEGERITVIGPDGKTITLRGRYSGKIKVARKASNRKGALAALINTRNARTSSVGVVRGASDAAALPDPWFVDISRDGERCLLEGEQTNWWRPDNTTEQKFSMLPVDRSWRADFTWKVGSDLMAIPKIDEFERQSVVLVRMNGKEYPISINMLPADLNNDFILASWMIEKGCVQQADALLKTLENTAIADEQASVVDQKPAVVEE